MKILILYDSYFGNTEKIAKTIYQSLQDKGDVEIHNVKDFKQEMLDNVNLLIVGSPTRAFRATESTTKMIKSIKDGSLNCTKVATFDTRMDIEKSNSKILAFMVNLFGYAAEPMLKQLTKKGGIPITEPIGFYVEDTEGPLSKDEEQKAKEWTKKIL
jgi:flavodoxin